MIMGLSTVSSPVRDLDSARKWYSELLGLAPYFDKLFYVGFTVGDFELGLIPEGEPGTDGPRPLCGVADAEASLAPLTGLGARPLESLTDVGGGIRVALVLDPFGKRFGMIENPRFDPTGVKL